MFELQHAINLASEIINSSYFPNFNWMILNINTKAIVRPHDGDTYSFDIITGVLQGKTLASFERRLIWQKWFYNKKKRQETNNII